MKVMDCNDLLFEEIIIEIDREVPGWSIDLGSVKFEANDRSIILDTSDHYINGTTIYASMTESDVFDLFGSDTDFDLLVSDITSDMIFKIFISGEEEFEVISIFLNITLPDGAKISLAGIED